MKLFSDQPCQKSLNPVYRIKCWFNILESLQELSFSSDPDKETTKNIDQ